MTSRVPVILTNIIDQLTQLDKVEIVDRFGEGSREDLKSVIGSISKLKYELQTDKPMLEVTGDEGDEAEWNGFLKEIEPRNSYYSSVWLYTECYVYRRLKADFAATKASAVVFLQSILGTYIQFSFRHCQTLITSNRQRNWNSRTQCQRSHES